MTDSLGVYAPDLMDRSKIAAASGNAPLTFVRRPVELADLDAPLLVVDLGRPGVLEVLPSLVGRGGRVVGFVNHTRADVIVAARAAGCEVMARSEFFRRLPDLLGGAG